MSTPYGAQDGPGDADAARQDPYATPGGGQDPQHADGSQHAYGSQPGYGAAPTYGAPEGYEAPQGYGGQPGYGAQPGYGTGGYAPMPQGGGYYGGPTGRESNGLGIWALCLGIASFLLSLGLLTGIPAIILGHKSRRAAAEGRADNGGLGLAGIILGWLAVVASVAVAIFLAVLISSPEFQQGFQESYESGY